MNNYAFTCIQVPLYVLIFHEKKRRIDILNPLKNTPYQPQKPITILPMKEKKNNDKNNKNMKKA